MDKWWAVSDKHGNIYAIRKYEMDILNIAKPGDKVFTVELSDKKFMWEIDENGNIQNKKEIESMKNNEKEIKADEGYQGYKNYETWNCHLWLGNDRGSWEFVRETVIEGRTEDESEWVGNVANILEEYLEEQMPDLGASMWGDLLQGAFDEIDFYEIAEWEINEYKLNEEAEKAKTKVKEVKE